MPTDPRFNGGGTRSLRFERNLALIFALLGVLLEALIAVYWLMILEPALRDDAESRARALAQAQARSIEVVLVLEQEEEQLLNALETRLDTILLLKEDESGEPLTNHIRLELDPDRVALPLKAMSLARGLTDCSGCFITEVPLYHPQDYALIGVATFHANTRSLERLLTDVRFKLLGAGGLILVFIGLAWGGVARLLHRLRESETNLGNLLEVVPFPILQLQSDGSGIQRANQAAADYLGLAPDERGRLDSLTWQALRVAGLPVAANTQQEVQISTAQGELRWAMVSVKEVFLSGIPHRLISLVDVSDLKATQQRLHQAANTDALTKLYNRRYLFMRLAQEIEQADRKGSVLSIILFDLDHFKQINDSFGHAVGDEVLVRIAELTRQCVRESDICGRYGGEEFLIILPSAPAAVALGIAERLGTKIRAERWSQPELHVTISGGVAEYADSTIDVLIETADRRLYQAKRAGRDRIVAES
ncbi:MAG: sensor domain-containing diguanylate cyclase [Lamprobacter sp.]|uniref:GGDEF domain-containing protein n=1 Tax=Lamprobacter sp. TaxID=3100796 RepID=UPI002B263B1A|nr:sensor domain-containing diguanylate cyclase [Lamprobacter sp.]MEA3639750.1 sensor domain-containing diguanylate cyclase [Lamprobacter sp.]